MTTPSKQSPIETEVEKYWKQIGESARTALALSGGVDSIVLGEALRRIGVDVVALHFNHRWRGRQSDLDAKWVEKWCRERVLPSRIGKAEGSGPTSENAARQERYAFFEESAKKLHIQHLWLAHHADDVVETFLMQLMRGAGPTGLSGIRDVRELGNLKVVRPLVSFTKGEIEAQAKAWKLSWRKDSSNASRDYLRNRVRLDVIPALVKAMGRDVKGGILRAARMLGDENAYWQTILPSHWPEKLRVSELKKMSTAQQRRWIMGWLEFHGVGDIRFENVEAVRALLTQLKPSKINLSRGVHCRRREGWIFMEN